MGCGYTPPSGICRPPLVIIAYGSAGLLLKLIGAYSLLLSLRDCCGAGYAIGEI